MVCAKREGRDRDGGRHGSWLRHREDGCVSDGPVTDLTAIAAT